MKHERLVRNIRHVFLFPFRLLPEGRVKTKLMHFILSFQNSVPLYLVLSLGDTAIQVGTPNPRTVRRFSRLAGKNGRVIIIEADPHNCQVLRNCITSKHLNNVVVVNKGAWSEKKTLTFYKSDDFKGDNKIPVEGVVMDGDFRNRYTHKIEIEADTIDNIFNELGVTQFNYLSITVNGSEFEVLKGARESLLSNTAGRIFSKGHARIGDARTGKPIHTLIKPYLVELGYDVIISRGEDSGLSLDFWQEREGDVFAEKAK